MTLGSSHPLTEISTRNLPGIKRGRHVTLKTSVPTMRRLSRQCASLCVPQPYSFLRSVTGIALFFFVNDVRNYKVEEDEVGGTCGTNGGEEERV
jgi:hypothetical protein